MRIGKIAETYRSFDEGAKGAINSTRSKAPFPSIIQRDVLRDGVLRDINRFPGCQLPWADAGVAGVAGTTISEITKQWLEETNQQTGKKKSLWEAFKEAWGNHWSELPGEFKEATELFDQFREWRRTEGSAIVESIAGAIGTRLPGVADWIRDGADWLGEKAKRIEDMYDGAVAIFTGDVKAVDRGMSAFSQEVGLPDFADISTRADKRYKYYDDTYKRMKKEGASDFKAGAYRFVGHVFTLAESVVDGVVQTTRCVTKHVGNALLKEGTKTGNVEAVKYGAAAKATQIVLDVGHESGFFSGIGNFFRSGIDTLFGANGKPKAKAASSSAYA